MKYFYVLFSLFITGFSFFSVECTEEKITLNQYLEQKIDEIAKEMSHLMVMDNYQIDATWIYLKGKFDAYNDVLLMTIERLNEFGHDDDPSSSCIPAGG